MIYLRLRSAGCGTLPSRSWQSGCDWRYPPQLLGRAQIGSITSRMSVPENALGRSRDAPGVGNEEPISEAPADRVVASTSSRLLRSR
jgi:hypothetical protein